jgi:iron(III) transport system permease protein
MLKDRLFTQWFGTISSSPARGAWLYLPAALVALVMSLPLIYLVVRASAADPSAWNWLLRAQTLQIMGQSVGLALAVMLAALILGVLLAWLVSRTDLPGRSIWSVLLPLPLVIPSYVGAYLFVSIFAPRGLLQNLLEGWLGIERLPSVYGFWGAWLVLTLMTYPYVFLAARAALSRGDRSQEEAARSLGCSPLETFWRVTLPQLRPALAASSLLVGLYVLRDFGAVSILRFTTFTRAIYLQYQSSIDRSAAALLSLVLILVTVGFLMAEQHIRRSAAESPHTAVHPAELIRLGRWQVAALGVVFLILLFGLIFPTGVLFYWLVRGMLVGEQIANWLRPLSGSVSAAGLAAIVTVLLVFPVSILSVRRSNWLSQVLEKWSYIGYAVPGIVIALALVFFGANFVPGLYQTLFMLLFAYVILFLPQAMGSIQSSLRMVQRSLEEAAASLGENPMRVFQRVTLPLIAPGVASAAAVVFLTTMKELPATLLLAPTGFSTLATQIWGAVSEAYFARAAAPALILILTSSISMVLINHHSTLAGSSQRQ